MLYIKADTQDTRETLTNLKDKINQLDAKSTENQTDAANLTGKLVILRMKVCSLDAKLSRNTSQRMQREITDIKAHSMKGIVTLSFDKQADIGRVDYGEVCDGLFAYLVTTVMCVTGSEHFSMSVSHRICCFMMGNKNYLLSRTRILSRNMPQDLPNQSIMFEGNYRLI